MHEDSMHVDSAKQGSHVSNHSVELICVFQMPFDNELLNKIYDLRWNAFASRIIEKISSSGWRIVLEKVDLWAKQYDFKHFIVNGGDELFANTFVYF